MNGIRDLFRAMRSLTVFCVGAVCLMTACVDEENDDDFVIDPLNQTESDHITLNGDGFTAEFPIDGTWKYLSENYGTQVYPLGNDEVDSLTMYTVIDSTDRAVAFYFHISKAKDKAENVDKLADVLENYFFPEDAGYKDLARKNTDLGGHNSVMISAEKWAELNLNQNDTTRFIEIDPHTYVETYLFFDAGKEKIMEVMFTLPMDKKNSMIGEMRRIAGTVKMK